jgi:hypothetical protein
MLVPFGLTIGIIGALGFKSGVPPGPFSFDHSAPFELEAKRGEKIEMEALRDSTTMPTLSIRLRVISFPLIFDWKRPVYAIHMADYY